MLNFYTWGTNQSKKYDSSPFKKQIVELPLQIRARETGKYVYIKAKSNDFFGQRTTS